MDYKDEQIQILIDKVREKYSKIRFWSIADVDKLIHTDPHDAIEDFLECTSIEYWPTVLEVKGYCYVQPSLPFHRILDFIIDEFDSEVGEDGEETKPTETMCYAEEFFIYTVLMEYKPYMCQVCIKKEVNTIEWIKCFKPELLEDDTVKKWIEDNG